MPDAIEINNLSFSYRSGTSAAKVLDGVSMTVATGRCVGIVGANGAGKTTLLKCIFDHAQHHSIAVSKPLQYVLDEPQVYSYLRGIDYIRFVLAIKSIDFFNPEITERINSLGKKLGLDQAVDELIAEYSFGMKRKVYLLPFLIAASPLMMLDEPTNGLDAQSTLALKEELASRSKQGKTTLVTSHNIGFLEDTCDEVYVLNGAKVAGKFTRSSGISLEEFYTSCLSDS